MAEPANILVADDDPGLRESLERTLAREGYRVVVASDGQAALERLQGGGVDLVLTDLKMPGLSGIERLSITRQITEEHGGEVRWTSRPGSGTRFTIRLPLKRTHG